MTQTPSPRQARWSADAALASTDGLLGLTKAPAAGMSVGITRAGALTARIGGAAHIAGARRPRTGGRVAGAAYEPRSLAAADAGVGPL